MAICCKGCKAEPKIPLWCRECEQVTCQDCLPQHASHEKALSFLCQQCEEDPGEAPTVFCDECEQHLCGGCDERIHNKGKRAKHARDRTSWETLQIKLVYVVCSDAQPYYGYISGAALMMDLQDSAPPSGFMVLMEKTKDLNEVRKLTNSIIKTFSGDGEFGEEVVSSLKQQFPMLEEIVFVESPATRNFHEIIQGKVGLKTRVFQLAEVISKPGPKMCNLSISSVSLPNSSFNNKSNLSNISAKYPRQESRHHLSINMSTSTENSLRKRKRKLPLLYYHPYICPKGDRRSEIQDQYRELAASGVLMIRKDHCKQFQERVLRQFNRNIGETEVEYISLQVEIQNLSIECLYWVIRSIQEDRMAPTEKLILSRLKESFDIKVPSKLWHYIIKYLSSNSYENERLELDRIGHIPRLMVHPFNNQDNYILYCKSDDVTPARWTYEDLSQLDESEKSWQQFLELINSYFISNTQIGGGRYGCVQYIKFNAPAPLKEASLGKLSMFVQEAINKGIIRYHKTLLVSNRGNEEKQQGEEPITLPQLQTSIKVNTLQLLLMDNFMETGPGVPISLAQIPQNLRKNASFQINYVDLGFPKLKNLLATLTDMVEVELSKSHIIFHLRADTAALLDQKRAKICTDTNYLLSQVIRELEEIIDTSNMPGVAMQELCNQLFAKTGLNLDCMLFNAPDFYRFLSYYGQNYFTVEINMGYFIVYKKWKEPVKKNQETSTPTFKQDVDLDYKFKYLENFNWEETVLKEWDNRPSPKEEDDDDDNEPEESESFSDYKSIYNLIDDNRTESQPQTVIVKEGSLKTANNGLFISKVNPIEEGEDSCSNGFEDVISELTDPRAKNSKGQHNRMYSNNAQQKTQHYRVYSNMSRN